MSEADTLEAFFGLDNPARAKASARALQSAQELREVRALPAAMRAPAADAIVWTAKALLKDSVSGVIGSAWTKLKEVQEAINAPADERKEITLAAHEIALSRTPSVDLVINGAPTGIALEFELKIALIITSAAAQIQNAHIVGATLGKVSGGGSLSLGRATLAERKTEIVRLPSRLTFEPAIALR